MPRTDGLSVARLRLTMQPKWQIFQSGTDARNDAARSTVSGRNRSKVTSSSKIPPITQSALLVTNLPAGDATAGEVTVEALVQAGRAGGLPLIFGLTIAAAPVEMIFSRFIGLARRLFPPVVTGVLIVVVLLMMLCPPPLHGDTNTLGSATFEQLFVDVQRYGSTEAKREAIRLVRPGIEFCSCRTIGTLRSQAPTTTGAEA